MLLGMAILLDLRDGALSVVLDTLAIFLVVEGLVEIGAAVSVGLRHHWIDALRGFAFLIAAFLVFNVPEDGNIGAAIIFGAAFLIDGLFRLATAFVVHGRRWRVGMVAGLIEVALAVIILSSWPLPHLLTVPFCFALLLLTSGCALLRMALPLRRLHEGASIGELPLYAAHNWHARTVRPVIENDTVRATGEVLNVYVWTPVGSIADPARRLLIDRYIAAVDRKGVISTGHSAVELPPDLYISHYPANDIDHNPDDFRALLSAGPENDVPGRFNKSLAIEAAAWCMPDQKVMFPRFNPDALRAFWQVYSQDTTYNLTARNCSSTAIQALDAATEGAAYTGHPWRDCFRLFSDPHFWMLRLVRGRAEEMTWTPGLVLDYSRLLERVLEHGHRRWRTRLSEALKSRRELTHRAERRDAGKAAA